MNHQTNYMKQNICYIDKKELVPQGIVIHSTASPGIMAKDWYDRLNYEESIICYHVFIDDTSIVQYLPWDYCGKHCLGEADNTHISIDLCEPIGHKILASKIVESTYNAYENIDYFNAVWKSTISLCVKLCKQFNIDVSKIISHEEATDRGIAKGYDDLSSWLDIHNKRMDDIRFEVKQNIK